MASVKMPVFVEPMLCGVSEPFDDGEYFFEPKWDGFRALCRVERGGVRLLGRHQTDFTGRFPELEPLSGLPNGTMLDGEIVIVKDGRPDFTSLLARKRPAHLKASYVAFDVLYRGGKSVMERPLEERVELLEAVVKPYQGDRLIVSSAVAGGRGVGMKMFNRAKALGLEGLIAKRRDSHYEFGQRSGAWLKIKARQQEVCAIIGYEVSQKREGDLRSLVLAGVVGPKLVCLGQVGTGFSAATRAELLGMLKPLEIPIPVVRCEMNVGRRGMYRWVKPELFCRVHFHERLPSGALRQAAFEQLVPAPKGMARRLSAA